MALYAPEIEKDVSRRPITSPADQIAEIVKAFSLTDVKRDTHAQPGDFKTMLLSSYCEWLFYELRLASMERYPGVKRPELYTPLNTRWGDYHFHRRNWPGGKWNDFPTPSTRAALVLWAVGAIDDIPDPLRDQIAAYDGALGAVETEYDEAAAAKLGRKLAEETPTPTTMAGAAAGLKFVLRSYDDGEHIADRGILQAVIRFLEREEPRP